MAPPDTDALTIRSAGASETTALGDGSRARSLDGGLQRGDALGRYLVLDVLGRGGMGVVYAAYDPKLDRRVAIKLVVDGKGSEEDSRLLREAQALAKLSHPNVVAVHDVGTWRGSVFVAMELVEGETVATWLERHHAEGPPSWREVLDIMIPAGHGLAAAHAAGIVHRDFKPHNVMLSPAGNVTVLDFGLARAVDPDATPSGTSGGITSLQSSLTETGTVMGTPAYMSPEQLEGQAADERSDQFSYCVSLYQALYGERPFVGRAIGDLLMNISTGTVRPPRPDDRVPAWLRRVVLRGLSPDPQERHSSMSELLAALRRPTKRPVSLVLTGVTVVLAGALGFSVWSDEQPPDPCAAADEAVARAWGPGPQEALTEAFRRDARAYSEQTLEQVVGELGRYADTWVKERRAACETAVQMGTDAGHDAARRARCLDQRMGRFEATVRLLGDADQLMVARAAQAVQDLPSPLDCREAHGWRSTTPVPDEPGARAEVEALLLRSDEVYALAMMGRLQQALPKAETILEEARAIEFAPLEGHALRTLGAVQVQLGQYADGKAHLQQALLLARAHQLELLELQTLDPLVFLAITVDDELALAEWLVRVQEVLAERLGDRPMLRARAVHNRARLAYARRDYPSAFASFEEAIGLYQSDSSSSPNDVLAALDNLTSAYERAERFDDAAATMLRAERIANETLGPAHPRHGHLLIHEARIAESRGRHTEAASLLERAVEHLEQGYGPRHPNVAAAYNGLAIALESCDRVAEAEAAYRRSIEIANEVLPANNPAATTSQVNLGNLLRRAGRADEALALHLAAREPVERRGSNEWGKLQVSIGDDMQALGHCDDAEAEYEASLATFAENEEEARLLSSRPRRGLAMCALQRGDLGRARALLEQMLHPLEGLESLDRWTLAEQALNRFALAMTLRDTEPERSATLAEQARAYWSQDELEHRRRLEQLEAWRAGGPARPLF